MREWRSLSEQHCGAILPHAMRLLPIARCLLLVPSALPYCKRGIVQCSILQALHTREEQAWTGRFLLVFIEL